MTGLDSREDSRLFKFFCKLLINMFVYIARVS